MRLIKHSSRWFLHSATAIAVLLSLPACGDKYASGQGVGTQTTVAHRLSTTEFAELAETLSEPSGYFDTDNLISNETSYLHVMGSLEELGLSGGAYIGVGPAQNFSYIAQIRPRIAFIVDIRRDNLLEHLLFKALFDLAETRLEYLCLLTGRQCPENIEGWRNRPVGELVAHLDSQAADADYANVSRLAIIDLVKAYGIELAEDDIATISEFRQAFVSAGLSLRFQSYNRPPRPDYPTLRQLLLETDRTGRQANYLATDSGFQFVKSLEERNLIVPVIGDLAGPQALRRIGSYITGVGENVSGFYTSNVEFYLMRQGTFARFVENVKSMPIDNKSAIIRSYFNRGYSQRLPQSVPGYSSTQLLQIIETFIEGFDDGSYHTYWDIVSRR